MINFIIPLKSKKVSNDWEQVSRLVESTLRSVCNQTSPEFNAIVVCHEKPVVNYNHPNIKYLEVDFPIPYLQANDKSEASGEFDTQSYSIKRLDKSRKLWAGLRYSQEFSPSHVMFVDADDYVSKNIAGFVSENAFAPGWKLCKGYEYAFGSNEIYLRKKNFNLRTGTSHILRLDSLLDEIIDFELLTGDYLRHQSIDPMMKKKGEELSCLPFIGSVYVTENSENIRSQIKYYHQRNNTLPKKIRFHVGRKYRSIMSTKITQSIKNEFHIM